MPIDLAGLPVEIGFILAHAATAHEFERELYVRKADRHRATSEYPIKDVDRAPGIRGQPARRTEKPGLVIVKTRFWLPGRFLRRRFPGWFRKSAVLNGGPRVRIQQPPGESRVCTSRRLLG